MLEDVHTDSYYIYMPRCSNQSLVPPNLKISLGPDPSQRIRVRPSRVQVRLGGIYVHMFSRTQVRHLVTGSLHSFLGEKRAHTRARGLR